MADYNQTELKDLFQRPLVKTGSHEGATHQPCQVRMFVMPIKTDGIHLFDIAFENVTPTDRFRDGWCRAVKKSKNNNITVIIGSGLCLKKKDLSTKMRVLEYGCDLACDNWAYNHLFFWLLISKWRDELQADDVKFDEDNPTSIFYDEWAKKVEDQDNMKFIQNFLYRIFIFNHGDTWQFNLGTETSPSYVEWKLDLIEFRLIATYGPKRVEIPLRVGGPDMSDLVRDLVPRF